MSIGGALDHGDLAQDALLVGDIENRPAGEPQGDVAATQTLRVCGALRLNACDRHASFGGELEMPYKPAVKLAGFLACFVFIHLCERLGLLSWHATFAFAVGCRLAVAVPLIVTNGLFIKLRPLNSLSMCLG